MNLSPYLVVQISPDRYSATATVIAIPAASGVVSSDVADCLRAGGVMTGFKLLEINNVLRALQNAQVGSSFVVAEGKRKEEGLDGSEEFRFRTKLLVGAENADKLDFKERGLINNVRPGQVLAILKAHVPGKPGLLVTGESDEPAAVKQVAMLKAGINVEQFDEEGKTSFIAMTEGHARKLFDEIQVCEEYIVVGDLDLTKGNIDFVRNVEIMGDVKGGFKIRAGGDIVVGGDVEPDAELCAEGSITVRGSIRSGKKGVNVFCTGDLTAGSIVNSHVECNGNVYLKELISDSLVLCTGKFLSAWGVILGSTIEAVGGMSINNAGKEDSTSQNLLFSGEPYRTRDRVTKVSAKLEDCRNQLELITRQVALEKNSAKSAEDEARLKNIAKARAEHARQLKEEIEILGAELAILTPKLIINTEAEIKIKGKVYPSCSIRIGDTEVSVLDVPIPARIMKYHSAQTVPVAPTAEAPVSAL